MSESCDDAPDALTIARQAAETQRLLIDVAAWTSDHSPAEVRSDLMRVLNRTYAVVYALRTWLETNGIQGRTPPGEWRNWEAMLPLADDPTAKELMR